MEQTDPNGFTLNICSPNDKFINQIRDTSSNVVRLLFIPKTELKITRVCDDNGLICECEGDPTPELFHKDDTPYLLWVQGGYENSRYFVKEGGKWNEITLDKYMNTESCLIMLANPDKHITIDVSKPEDTKFWKIDEYNYGDKKQVTFLPNFGYYARAVVDGGKTIWKAENDAQRCIVVTISYNQNQKEDARVSIRDMRGIKSINYKWVKGQWDETDDATFFDPECSYDSEDSMEVPRDILDDSEEIFEDSYDFFDDSGESTHDPEYSESEETLRALSDLVVTCQ